MKQPCPPVMQSAHSPQLQPPVPGRSLLGEVRTWIVRRSRRDRCCCRSPGCKQQCCLACQLSRERSAAQQRVPRSSLHVQAELLHRADSIPMSKGTLEASTRLEPGSASLGEAVPPGMRPSAWEESAGGQAFSQVLQLHHRQLACTHTKPLVERTRSLRGFCAVAKKGVVLLSCCCSQAFAANSHGWVQLPPSRPGLSGSALP